MNDPHMSAAQIIVWFVWGFFMGLGWVIASWIWSSITSRWFAYAPPPPRAP